MVLSVCRLGQTNTVTNVNRTVTTFFASPPLGLRLAISPLTRIAAQSDLSSRGGERKAGHPRLKYCTARSCFCAAARLAKVPRLRRLPVFGFFLRE